VAVENAAWFVVSEALTNAAKHSHAERAAVWVTLRNAHLHVEVVDDGRGGADTRGSGLKGLAQRVEALDGALEVHSPSGGPTVVRALLPCGW
jgi:signal transduction histidine kinase